MWRAHKRVVVIALRMLCAIAGLTQARDASAADVAFGEYLSGECTTCHRRDGQNKGIPSIVGWPEQQFLAAMMSYKAKQRTNPVMQTIAARLSDHDLAALAAYYASLKPR